MSAGKPAEWLSATAGAVRQLLVERLSAGDLDADARRATENALKEFDVTWAQLEVQAAQLALEKERYAAFFEFAPQAYLITDIGGGVREANLAALELLGVSREDLIGRALSEHVAEHEGIGVLARRAQRCRVSVRPIALKRSGVQGQCWLLRPLEEKPG